MILLHPQCGNCHFLDQCSYMAFLILLSVPARALGKHFLITAAKSVAYRPSTIKGGTWSGTHPSYLPGPGRNLITAKKKRLYWENKCRLRAIYMSFGTNHPTNHSCPASVPFFYRSIALMSPINIRSCSPINLPPGHKQNNSQSRSLTVLFTLCSS